MKKIARYFAVLLVVVLFSVFAVNAQTTVFTYNGKLPDDYNQPTGQFDFQFNLYAEATGSNSPLNSTPIVLEDVQVTNGEFTVLLDFGNLFDGSNRYLEIGERAGNSTGDFTVLSSRHQILSLPYTIRSLSAATADLAANAQNLGGTNANVFVQNTDSRLSDPRDPSPGSNNYIQNRTSSQSGANFNISGTGTASVFNATTQFNISGSRALYVGAGAHNIFAGSLAGDSNTTGAGNSFFGNVAGWKNTSGNSNSFFGDNAGDSNTTGSFNSFVGTAAGDTNTTGSNNSFIGSFAGGINSSGGNNSFFGYVAGGANTVGSNNTILGAAADVSAGGLSFATALGAGTIVSTSNTVVIGRSAGQDTVKIPGSLIVSGTISGNVSGVSLTNLNASNITTGTLNNARLGLIPTTNIADGAISTTKIADSAVTAAKIANNQVVRSLNGLTDSVNLAAGANVTITPSGNTLTISASAAGGNFIHNTTAQQAGSNFNISGNGTAANLTASSTLSGNVVNATTQYNIGGTRVLSVAGNANTFAGATAGHNNSSGASNSFFGASSGYSNTEGYSNSFFGTSSGLSNITGIYNSFFGTSAGYNNTTGHTNAFFGTSAGYNNTTGSVNAFLGRSAGWSNTTGDSNTYVGTSAGFYSTTGSNNSFVGTSAGYNSTEGYNNSFFGYGAGLSNLTGHDNTLIGIGADVSANNLSFATAIGAQATVSSNNTIVLGRSSGSDTVLIPGLLQLNLLGTAGINHLCRNASNQFAPCSSSLRYKTDIAPFSSGLNLIQRLRPITFTWKEGGLKDMGFGAEEIAAVEPLLVTYNANGAVEGVKYDRISAVLVNAVKEQQTQIEVQQTQLTQQRAAIEAQDQQLRQQQITIDGLKKLLCNQNPKADVCQNK